MLAGARQAVYGSRWTAIQELIPDRSVEEIKLAIRSREFIEKKRGLSGADPEVSRGFIETIRNGGSTEGEKERKKKPSAFTARDRGNSGHRDKAVER